MPVSCLVTLAVTYCSPIISFPQPLIVWAAIIRGVKKLIFGWLYVVANVT